MSDLQAKANDFELTAVRLRNVSALKDAVGKEHWCGVMLDLAGQAQRELIEIYKELLPGARQAAEAGKLAATLTS